MFDVEGARRAGYTDAEIADHLAQARNFDAAAARQAGYSDADLIAHLIPPPAQAAPAARPPSAVERLATGLGDPLRAAEQIGARAIERGQDSGLMRVLRSNPNIAAVMDQAVPPETPQQVDARIADRERGYQAARAAGGGSGFDPLRVAGNVAATLPVAAAMPMGGGLLGSAAAGATQGAALSALQPSTSGNFADDKKAQMEMGAALGAVAGPIGYAVGRAISPRVSPDARALAAEGVQMTPGQMLGGNANRVEQAVASFPWVGETVRGARRASVETFNRAAANRVLRPLNATVPDDLPAGRDMVSYVAQRVSQAYDDAYSRVQPFSVDGRFAADMAKIGQSFMTPRSRTEYNSIIRDQVLSRLQATNGQIDAGTYNTIRSTLERLSRDFKGSQDAAQREMARGFSSMRQAFDDLVARTNPQAAPDIRRAQAAYRQLTRLEDAASRQGAVDGVFTPAQISQSVRMGDRSVRRRDFARGDAEMQDLTDTARRVLPQTVPDSGTPERMAVMGLVGGGANALGYVSPLQLLAAGAAYGAYTPPAQRAIQRAIMAPRSPTAQAVGDALARSGGAATVPLSALLFPPSSP